MNLAMNLECADQTDDAENGLYPMKSEITREQLLKEAPQLIEYAILRGWMSKPKPKRNVDGVWHSDASGHLDNASEDEIQELRKQFGGG